MRCKKLFAALTALAMLPVSVLGTHAADRQFVYGTDNWNFGNSPLVLGNYYRLTEQDQKTMEQTLSHTERRIFDHAMQMKWQGCCYGLAVTSLLAYHGIMDLREYSNGAEYAHQVPLTEELISVIDYYQQMQCSEAMQREMRWSAYHETSEQHLEQLLTLAKEGKPAVLCYEGNFMDKGQYCGHAVVAYGLEETDYEWEGRHYDERVLIYDVNFNGFEDSLCLYHSTTEGDWCIPGYHLSSGEGDKIGFVSADMELLNSGGLIHGTTYHSDKPTMAELSSTKLDGSYTCTKTAFDGTVWADTDDDSEIRQMCYFFGNSLVDSDMSFIMPDTQSGYWLHAEQEQPMDTNISYEDLLLIAEGTAQDVRFAPDGSVRISGSGQPYQLEIVSNESRYAGVLYDLVVSGDGADVQLSLAEDGYLLQGKALWDVTITGSGENTEDVLCIATDAERVLIRETEDQKLAASIDLDGDGSFETALEDARSYGDLNADSEVNASDAAQLLIAAAKIGAGSASGMTPAQEQAADVDGNGEINAADAALILMYAAEAGSGNFTGTLMKYVLLRSR